MPPEMTTVSGTIYSPHGIPVTGGRLKIKITDPATDPLVASPIVAPIGSAGEVSVPLVPNDSLLPADTLYEVHHELPDGYVWAEYWQVATAPDPVELGDVARPFSIEPHELAPLVPEVLALPAPSAYWHRRVLVLSTPGAAQTLWVCLLQSDGVTLAWVQLGMAIIALEPFSGWTLSSASVDSANEQTAPDCLKVNTSFGFGAPTDGFATKSGIALVSGKTYMVDFWVNGANAFEGGGWFQRVTISADRGDGSFIQLGASITKSAAPGWTRFQRSFTANGTTGRIRVQNVTQVGGGGGPIGTFYWLFDNV